MDSVPVHAADTLAILNLHFDESIIAPVLAPRVLNLPVVLVALRVRLSTTLFLLLFAAYPPIVDAAFLDGLVFGTFWVADDYHGVVDRHPILVTGRVITALFQCAAPVELELSWRGSERNSTRLLCYSLLHLLDIILALYAPGLRFSNNLCLVVFASLILCLVRVVIVAHGALFIHEFPRGSHPAAATAISSISFTELVPVILSVCCAINTLLFREAYSGCFIVYADGSFKSWCCCESPARAAATLILDRGHVLCVIYCGGLSDTKPARSFIRIFRALIIIIVIRLLRIGCFD